MNRNEEREKLVQVIADNLLEYNKQTTAIVFTPELEKQIEGLRRKAAEQIVLALRKDLCDG